MTECGLALPFREWPPVPHVQLGPLGAEPPLNETASQLQETVREFAMSVLRPIGIELDRLTADRVIASDSRFWEYRSEYQKLGITMEALSSFATEEIPDIVSIVFEELGWGDSGLAISAAADLLPHFLAGRYQNTFIPKTYSSNLVGAAALTEPDHGSNAFDQTGITLHANGRHSRPNCIARLTDGKVIINGQKSAWISNGPIADLAVVYCVLETANGVDFSRGVSVVVPTSLAGVSRGRPLEKMGQRPLPQGELVFENVEIDIDHLLTQPEDYIKAVYALHLEVNVLMGSVFTGAAKAAFDLALEYAHERKQGGVPIGLHQDVARRLFHMGRKVELARALTRRVANFNALSPVPALQAGLFSKVTSTQMAFEVASDAVQMFGGNGLAREYAIEKIFRDTRASLIEDGCNEVIAIKGGSMMLDPARLDGINWKK